MASASATMRFIPTPVGSIFTDRPASAPVTVHPHACGEYLGSPAHRNWGVGSSPRLWGVSCERMSAILTERFIPTPVGSIKPISPCGSPWPVHPHACGEYGEVRRLVSHTSGSSPRLWGVCLRRLILDVLSRFIPTPVGSIVLAAGQRHRSPVHPHACGEYAAPTDLNAAAIGSSPRLWGVCEEYNGATVGNRFIPTPVGSI